MERINIRWIDEDFSPAWKSIRIYLNDKPDLHIKHSGAKNLEEILAKCNDADVLVINARTTLNVRALLRRVKEECPNMARILLEGGSILTRLDGLVDLHVPEDPFLKYEWDELAEEIRKAARKKK